MGEREEDIDEGYHPPDHVRHNPSCHESEALSGKVSLYCALARCQRPLIFLTVGSLPELYTISQRDNQSTYFASEDVSRNGNLPCGASRLERCLEFDRKRHASEPKIAQGPRCHGNIKVPDMKEKIVGINAIRRIGKTYFQVLSFFVRSTQYICHPSATPWDISWL